MTPDDDALADLELAIERAEILTCVQASALLELIRFGLNTAKAGQELAECMDRLAELRSRKFIMQESLALPRQSDASKYEG